MTPRPPDITSSFDYEGITYGVEWFDLPRGKSLPDLPWRQVYAIGDCNGKVPVVHYPALKDNLPGGKLDPGEDAKTALYREIEEELNMRVLSWCPIGYQLVTYPDGRKTYELRVYAKMEVIGAFVNDPGGDITGHTLVPIDKLNAYINYGTVGERIIEIYKNIKER